MIFLITNLINSYEWWDHGLLLKELYVYFLFKVLNDLIVLKGLRFILMFTRVRYFIKLLIRYL